MPKKATPLVAAWSYSRYDDYRSCPRRFKYKHIDKKKESQGPAAARGQEIHDTLEAYMLKHKKTLSKELIVSMGPLKKELDQLKKARAVPEQQVAFDRGWNIVDWFAAEAWLRVVVDLSLLVGPQVQPSAKVVDYKSGKINEAKHAEQLDLYGIYGFLKFPEAEEVIAEPWYVDHGVKGAPLVFANRRRDLPRLKNKWEKAVAPMFRDQQFKPTPGTHCKWCPFSGRRGGPCDKG